MKCPYCGKESDSNRCSHCFAEIPVGEKPKEEPEKAKKKTVKE